MDLKTSEEWCRELGVFILDADGWDRSNYDYSFCEELISLDEFNIRKGKSTVLWDSL